MVLCHRRLAVVIFFLIKKRTGQSHQYQYFIPQGMGQCSMFLTFYTIYVTGFGENGF